MTHWYDRRDRMDTMVTGEGASQPEPETVAAAPEPPAGGVPGVGSPPAAGPPKKRNWMLIALIAVSCAALLLLGSTITLAVVGDFGGGRKAGFRFDRPDGLNRAPMEAPDGANCRCPAGASGSSRIAATTTGRRTRRTSNRQIPDSRARRRRAWELHRFTGLPDPEGPDASFRALLLGPDTPVRLNAG